MRGRRLPERCVFPTHQPRHRCHRLAQSAQSITCVGAATPIPDWSAFLTNPSTIPARCAGGTDGASSVRRRRMSRCSIRASGSRDRCAQRLIGPVPCSTTGSSFGVQAIVSNGLEQQGLVDVNLNATPRFRVVNDGRSARVRRAERDRSEQRRRLDRGQPSLAGVSACVGTALGSRFTSRQLTSAQARYGESPIGWDLTYTLLDARENTHGFTSTAGNPFDVQWGPHLQAGRTSICVRWSDFPVFDVVYLSRSCSLKSGQRYTPMIAGDVNGDGRSTIARSSSTRATSSDTATAVGDAIPSREHHAIGSRLSRVANSGCSPREQVVARHGSRTPVWS